MPMLLRPQLLLADHPNWRRQTTYSDTVADALRKVFTHIASGDAPLEELERACQFVAPWHGAKVAAPQEIRILLLFARRHEVEGDYAEALRWLDDALEEAARGRARSDLIDLLVYHAKLARAQGNYDVAADDLDAALSLLLADVDDDEEYLDPGLRLELLAQLASYEFFRGQFARAQQLTHEALRLAPLAPARRLEAAAAARTQVHLDRARNRSWQALSVMRHVVAVYAQAGAPDISRGRNECLAAECALDVAESVPDGPGAVYRTQPLALADNHLGTAEILAQQTKDAPGLGLVALGRIRHSRLRGANVDRVSGIEDVMRRAERLDDVALLAQAFTALGNEWMSHGETERALDCFRQTLGILDGSAFSALGIVARRNLLAAREMGL